MDAVRHDAYREEGVTIARADDPMEMDATTVRRLLEEVVSITDRASETRQDLLAQLGAAIASTHRDWSRSWDRESEDAYLDDGHDDDDR
jgi:hypothetical protein